MYKMRGKSKETRPIFVEDSRKQWIESTTQFKPYFIEKVIDCLSEPITIESKKIPTTIYDDDDNPVPEEMTYSGDVHLKWCLTGGIVYEYIYEVDTTSSDSLFTTTSDVDVPVKIMDSFSDEFNIVDPKRLLSSEFFEEIVLQIIKRLITIDFSNMDDIFDELPPTDEVDYIDNGKVRIICAEKSCDGDIVMNKIQLFISKDGYYDEIMDIMVNFEVANNKDTRDQMTKVGSDGIVREIYFSRIFSLLNGELNALLERFELKNVKTENHIGRILYLLDKIDDEDNELDKYSAASLCEMFIGKVEKKLKVYTEDLRDLVLAEYKGRKIRMVDIVWPISEYALSRHRQRFIMLFSP